MHGYLRFKAIEARPKPLPSSSLDIALQRTAAVGALLIQRESPATSLRKGNDRAACHCTGKRRAAIAAGNPRRWLTGGTASRSTTSTLSRTLSATFAANSLSILA